MRTSRDPKASAVSEVHPFGRSFRARRLSRPLGPASGTHHEKTWHQACRQRQRRFECLLSDQADCRFHACSCLGITIRHDMRRGWVVSRQPGEYHTMTLFIPCLTRTKAPSSPFLSDEKDSCRVGINRSHLGSM